MQCAEDVVKNWKGQACVHYVHVSLCVPLCVCVQLNVEMCIYCVRRSGHGSSLMIAIKKNQPDKDLRKGSLRGDSKFKASEVGVDLVWGLKTAVQVGVMWQ